MSALGFLSKVTSTMLATESVVATSRNKNVTDEFDASAPQILKT